MRSDRERTLEQLAEFGDPHGADAVWRASQRELRRRRRLHTVPVVALVVLFAVGVWNVLPHPMPSVEVGAGPAGRTPTDPCPETEASSMNRRQVAALIAGGALLAACTDTVEPLSEETSAPAAEDGTDVPSASRGATPGNEFNRMTAEITGDLRQTMRLEVRLRDMPATIIGPDRDTLLSGWMAEQIAPTEVTFHRGNDHISLRWDQDSATFDLDNPSVIVKLDGYSFVSQSGDCSGEIQPWLEGAFFLEGTIECRGLTGLKPGVEDRPTIDTLRAEFRYGFDACADDDPEARYEPHADCEPVQAPG